MASKRCDGSILEYFTKKIKTTSTSPSVEEIPLTNLTDLSTSAQDVASVTLAVNQTSSLANPLNLSNTNDLLQNCDESENQIEILDTSNKSSNENKQTPSIQTTNLSTSRSSTKNAILTSKCDLYCCNSSIPYHPMRDDELLLTTIEKRSCQKQWFVEHSWLAFCKVKKNIFCHLCGTAFEREIHRNTMKLQLIHRSFVVEGFSDWKNARSRFKLHESTKMHGDSIYVLSQQTKPTVATQLISATQKQQEQRRKALSIQISCIIYLLRQGLALRGHSDIENNLIQLLKLRNNDNECLNEWIENKKYLSHDIINELCKEIYLFIIRDIVKEISKRKWFALICDETCDESTLEQLCVAIRSVDDNYEIFEDILGLYELSRQDAPTIVEAIQDVLTRCGLNLLDCRGQSYDGASNMSGAYSGVSALILRQQPKAMYVHCTAHCLDLAVHDSTDLSATISICISFVKEIIDFVRRSPKRLAILKEISNQLSMPYSNLTPLCPTRWTMRTESYNSLLKNYKLVQEALYSFADEKGVLGIKVDGLYETMKKFSFFFGLKLGHLIFSAKEKLSRSIQSSSCCLEDVLCAAESVIQHFQRIQDDNSFKSFYSGVLKDSVDLTDEPVLPRCRRPPRRYDSNSAFVNFSNCEEYYRKQYIEALEIVINMLQKRFTQNNFK